MDLQLSSNIPCFQVNLRNSGLFLKLTISSLLRPLFRQAYTDLTIRKKNWSDSYITKKDYPWEILHNVFPYFYNIRLCSNYYLSEECFAGVDLVAGGCYLVFRSWLLSCSGCAGACASLTGSIRTGGLGWTWSFTWAATSVAETVTRI